MTILTVTQINNQAKYSLESNFKDIWVRGELVSPKLYPSGHLYFSLKDENSEISCVFFSADIKSCNTTNGTRVVISGQLSLYNAKGRYQFLVKNLYPEGEGEQWRQFEALKKKLEEEGLFAESRKIPIPKYPKKIGFITSEQGAVLWDMLHNFEQKQTGTFILVRPAKVQGINAAQDIINALIDFEEYDNVDVIVIARGGGSQEDLGCFNDEQLARKIYSCHIPVITAIGHETDFTIADFTADLRAPTPSYAAEILARPFMDQRQTVDSFRGRLSNAMIGELSIQNKIINQIKFSGKLRLFSRELSHSENEIQSNKNRLKLIVTSRIKHLKTKLNGLITELNLHHPDRWLDRGFVHVTNMKNATINSINSLSPGQKLCLQFKDGKAKANVEKLIKEL